MEETERTVCATDIHILPEKHTLEIEDEKRNEKKIEKEEEAVVVAVDVEARNMKRSKKKVLLCVVFVLCRRKIQNIE